MAVRSARLRMEAGEFEDRGVVVIADPTILCLATLVPVLPLMVPR